MKQKFKTKYGEIVYSKSWSKQYKRTKRMLKIFKKQDSRTSKFAVFTNPFWEAICNNKWI